jgi:hypothetical protein
MSDLFFSKKKLQQVFNDDKSDTKEQNRVKGQRCSFH